MEIGTKLPATAAVFNGNKHEYGKLAIYDEHNKHVKTVINS